MSRRGRTIAVSFPSTLRLAALGLTLVLAAACTGGSGPGYPVGPVGADEPDARGYASLPAARSTGRPADPPAVKEPAALIGQSAEDVASLLGEPALRRRDGPAQVWQYRGNECVLDLFLYDDTAAPPVMRVNHAELRARQRATIATPACFADLLRESRETS